MTKPDCGISTGHWKEVFTPVGCAKRKIIFHFPRLQNLETKFLVDNCSDIQEDSSITPVLR